MTLPIRKSDTKFINNDTEERVLIVDDEASVRQVLGAFLDKQGYAHDEAENGEQAWELLKQRNYNTVISDINMPVKSGTELLKIMRQKKPQIPVILITGMPSVEAAVECMRTGAYEYISKPFNLAKLRDTIKSAVNEYRLALDMDVLSGRGRAIAGYQIERTLGEGNSGIVFQARRQGDPDSVAIKILKTNNLASEQRQIVLHRFLNEAEAASKLKHPNVIDFREYGLTQEDNIPYLVMELFEGTTIEDDIDFVRALPWKDILVIIRQIAEAMKEIHSHNISHRDIKPGNIMLDKQQLTIKINDFGIAKLPESSITAASSIMGSPAYMSPESFLSPDVDPRADIFSLGVVAYELLTGQRPFSGENVALISRQIQWERPIAPDRVNPNFPNSMEPILKKMLQKKPEQRYQTADEVIDALNRVAALPNGAKSKWTKRFASRFSKTWSYPSKEC